MINDAFEHQPASTSLLDLRPEELGSCRIQQTMMDEKEVISRIIFTILD